ncbi:MAG: winged helix DNA-binding protein [Erysipelothrix sp.]|nr:winged helix DNA-binding protein [Erysipelothrix sp.]
MGETRELVHHIIVDVFNDVLKLQEKFLQSKGINLSISEVHTLEAIGNADKDNRMTDIANKLDITLSTLSINIKRLIKKGYVVKEIDPDDRRIVHVLLTDSAYDILSIHHEFHEELVSSFFDELEIGEDQVLLESLEKIDAYLAKMIKKLK